ncbi:MAG: PQQ-dependent sugar dehydrogenase, partial [Acidimicrobiales bacterium]
VDQPYANHNGGNVVFGPDGHLYLGLGDGGSGGDPENRAQNPQTLLGKLVRFAATSPPGQPEIWASGLRNPWRFSFDRATHDLWLADVGQGNWEEVNQVALGSLSGGNFGWSGWEGSHPYKPHQQKPGALFPVYEYPHDGRCSITGGYVYRGAALTQLAGAYLYGDFCDGEVRALIPGVIDQPLGLHVERLASFAEDAAGELYVLSLDGGVYRIDPA